MNQEWLKQLAPDRAPAPPSWWPLAVGWWMVIAFIVLLMIAAWWWYRSKAATVRRQQRMALAELQRIGLLDDHHAVACGVQNLLRRYALTLFGHERVAKLSGMHWLQFVAAHGGDAFAGETGRSLLSAAFGGSASSHREQWLEAARQFIRRAPRFKQKGQRA